MEKYFFKIATDSLGLIHIINCTRERAIGLW